MPAADLPQGDNLTIVLKQGDCHAPSGLAMTFFYTFNLVYTFQQLPDNRPIVPWNFLSASNTDRLLRAFAGDQYQISGLRHGQGFLYGFAPIQNFIHFFQSQIPAIGAE